MCSLTGGDGACVSELVSVAHKTYPQDCRLGLSTQRGSGKSQAQYPVYAVGGLVFLLWHEESALSPARDTLRGKPPFHV